MYSTSKRELVAVEDTDFLVSAFQLELKGISIAMPSGNNYVLPTVVSMTSVMKNSAQDFRCNFYVMHPPSLSKGSQQKGSAKIDGL